MKCYWNNTGVYQAHSDALLKLLPEVGVCANANQNPELEKFRKAVNCYYDLYNNGLCNKAVQFALIFKITGVAEEIRSRRGLSTDLSLDTMLKIEVAMGKIIKNAVLEQFLKGAK